MRGQTPKNFREKEDKSTTLAKTKATDAQWELIDIAIKAFMAKYPYHWKIWQDDLTYQRTKYQLATKDHKELKQASWRNTASFPVILDREGNIIDGILPVLEKIIPKLTHNKSVNYVTFLRKYPMFLPGMKF